MKIFIFFVLFSFCNGLDIVKPSIYNKNYHNIDNWIMSEKLDGIRAIWTGKELLTKNGNKINVPEFYTKDFPSFMLDGELWTQRDDFENIQSIVLSQNSSKFWENISYNIFEVPNQVGNFYSRLKILEDFLKNNPNKFIKIIPQIKIANKEHINKFMDEILKNKGEGIIIRNPFLDYEKGRSQNILKVKTFFDVEGEVISYNYNKNKLLNFRT